VALVLAIPFGARAILEVAWYRYRRPSRRADTWLQKGQHRLGMSRPAFIGIAVALLLAAAGLLIVVGNQFGVVEVQGLIGLALVAVAMIAALTGSAVVWFTWASKHW